MRWHSTLEVSDEYVLDSTHVLRREPSGLGRSEIPKPQSATRGQSPKTRSLLATNDAAGRLPQRRLLHKKARMMVETGEDHVVPVGGSGALRNKHVAAA
jgi:hypothetical protein